LALAERVGCAVPGPGAAIGLMTFADHYFSEQALHDWTAVAERHRIRDEYFLRTLQKYFHPGPILEIGAATGHVSAILHNRGYDVTASDVSPRFVAAIAARGVPALLVDATRDIRLQTGRSFTNVVAQNVIPLIRRDHERLHATLLAIHAALDPSGRLICINARTSRCRNRAAFFRPREQMEIIRNSSLFRIVTSFPHQVIPTGLYRGWNARVFNLADFKLARIAAVRLVSIAEKIS
jgi:SAM-dependent methyltransferase